MELCGLVPGKLTTKSGTCFAGTNMMASCVAAPDDYVVSKKNIVYDESDCFVGR